MHLRYALAIEETGSVTRAAEQMFVAQPNISRAIRELEASLGMKLFQRTPLGMVATEDGKPFLERARHIVQEIESLKSVYESGGSARRHFAACSHGGRYVAAALAKFAAQQRDENFLYHFAETSTASVLSGVAQGLYGLGIIRFLLRDMPKLRHLLTAHELTVEPLFTTPLLYTVSERSPLAEKKTVRPSDTRHLREVTGEAIWSPEAERQDISRRIRVQDRDSQMLVLSRTENAYMLSVKEDKVLLGSHKLLQRPSEEEHSAVRDAVVFRKQYVRTKQDKDFLNHLEEEIKIYTK